VAEWGEANRPRVADFLKIFDAQLGKHKFAAGDNFSVADITALVAVDFMKPAKIEMPADLKNVQRWHAEVSARPSAKA
jgi:glutathione S-transferase